MKVEGFISFRNSTPAIPFNTNEDALLFTTGWLALCHPVKGNADNSRILIGASRSDPRNAEFRQINLCNDTWASAFSDSSIDLAHFEKADIVAWYKEKNQTILLSRDVFGTVPLYYLHIPGSFFAFSTSLISLMKMKCSRSYLEIDKERVNSYCNFQQDQASGYTSRTFYNAIKTVLPGHLISVSSDQLISTPYVSFNPEKWSKLSAVADYGKIFNELFRKSIKRSAERTNKKIASHLSGGLDSSSVSTMLREIVPDAELHTLYSETRTRYTDEAGFAACVAKQIGSVHHDIDPPENDLENLSLYTSLYGHPECMVLSPSLQGSLIHHARELGCDVLLMGHDGDSVVGTGLELTQKAFFSGRWEDLKLLIGKRAPHAPMQKVFPDWDSYDPEHKYKAYVRHFTVARYFEVFRKLPAIKAFRLMTDISKNMDVPVSLFVKKVIKSAAGKLRAPNRLSQSLIKGGNYRIAGGNQENAPASLSKNLPERYRNAFGAVYNSQSMVVNEQFFALGNHYGIHNRFPLYEKDLFELCMATPGEIKFGNGIGREHFREAMKGLLPENVRTRPSKANFSLYGRQAVIRLHHQSKDLMADLSNPVWDYIYKDKYEKAVRTLLREEAPEFLHNRSQFQVLRAISLAVWLDWLARFQLNMQMEDPI